MYSQTRRWRGRTSACGLALAVLLTILPSSVRGASTEVVRVEGLSTPVRIDRDDNGIVGIVGERERQLIFAQGWAHARDRLFQMDVFRRMASGTLAELLGSAALADDIQLRTIGLRRAAETSLPALSADMRAALEAYAAGVNAWIAANPLPPEYGALSIGWVAPWEPLDSVAIGKLIVFQLSFELGDMQRTLDLQAYQGALGMERGSALFFEDIYRIAPFENEATLPGANLRRVAGLLSPQAPQTGQVAVSSAQSDASSLARRLESVKPATAELARTYLRRLDRTDVVRRLVRTRESGGGSNAFVIAGHLARGGRPLLANDPHLDLSAPSIFYPLRLRGLKDGFFVSGVGFAGLPYVMLGFNRSIAWGATASAVDVTDVYLEQLRNDSSVPSGLVLLYRGNWRPVTAIPQTFYANVGGRLQKMDVAPESGGVTLVTPRPDGGPILQQQPGGRALSVQWVGYAPTRELEAFRDINRARGWQEFRAALDHFDAGSENFLYADRSGTIAYVLSGEIPLREDLQAVRAGDVNAAERLVPPFLIREAAGHEWQTLAAHAAEGQALDAAILPANEMPNVVNPSGGVLVSANNDPLGDTFDNRALNQFRPGGGIRYLGADFDSGIRARRITRLIEDRLDEGRLDLVDLQHIQADVALPDAMVFVPHVVAALADRQAVARLDRPGAVTDAVARLARWSPCDGCDKQPRAPTGLQEGYDASDDPDGPSRRPTRTDIADSVATSIFSMWRAQMVADVIDAPLAKLGLSKPPSRYAHRALRWLIEKGGIGASGVDFFAAAGQGDTVLRRDVMILRSLEKALVRLAAAFGSANPDAWRWGRLHRVQMVHPLGDAFSPIGPDSPFVPPYPPLAGVPVDGGFEAVDRSTHDVRAGLAAPFNDFVFSMGPAQRFVARIGSQRIDAETALPGGVSSDPDSPWFANLLGDWLVNRAVALPGIQGEGGHDRVLLIPNHTGARNH